MAKVVVVYHSGYGHTQRMAQSVAQGADAELLAIDADGNLPEGGWETLDAADAIIFGSPTYMGSVSWQFKHLGEISVPRNGKDEDEFTLAAIDAGADDVVVDEDDFTVYTAVENLHATNDALAKAGYASTEAALTYLPTNKANPSSDDLAKLMRLLDALDDLDDVQETYVNVDITEDMLQEA